MLPTLVPGERLVATTFGTVRRGDVVAAHEPGTGLLVVKRVHAIGADGSIELQGDNASVSTDSRHYGPVPRAAVVGRVVWRYHPPAAAGRLGRGRRPDQR